MSHIAIALGVNIDHVATLRQARRGASPDPLQAALLGRAAGWLRPGGRLVYATCSLLADEGEAQVASLLARRPGLGVVPEARELAGVEPGWRTPEGGLRTRPDDWPEQGGLDGFYMVCLERTDPQALRHSHGGGDDTPPGGDYPAATR